MTSLGRDLHERPPPGQSGVDVVVKDVGAVGWCVVVVGAGAVRAPLKPIRDGDVLQHRARGPVGIEPVQRAGAGPLIVRHRPAVKAAVGVAASLVHPHLVVCPQVAQVGERSVGILQYEAPLHADDGSALAARRPGRHRPACPPNAGRPNAPTRPVPHRGKLRGQSVVQPARSCLLITSQCYFTPVVQNTSAPRSYVWHGCERQDPWRVTARRLQASVLKNRLYASTLCNDSYSTLSKRSLLPGANNLCRI